MDFFCHFHPTSPARWRCIKCARYFDQACTIMRLNQTTTSTPCCPVCQGMLRPLTQETQSQAGTAQDSSLFINSPFLLLLSGLVLLSAVSTFLHLDSQILLLLNLPIVFCVCFHYGRQIVFSKVFAQDGRSLKSGRSRTRYPQQSFWSGFQASIKAACVLCFLYVLPVWIFYAFHWLAGLLVMGIASALMPLLILLMLQHLDMQNELSARQMFRTINEYAGHLAGLNFALYCTCLTVMDLVFKVSPLNVAFMISTAILAPAMVFLLHRHALAYHKLYLAGTESLSLAGLDKRKTGNGQAIKQPLAKHAQSDKHPQLSTEIELALKTGEYTRAVELLEQALKQNLHSVLRRQQLYLLLSELNDLEKLSQYADIFLGWMLERGKVREASQFLYRLRKHNPAFVLQNIEIMNELAKEFTRQKKYALVLWLAEGSQKRFPPSEALASLYLSASQVLVTHYQDLQKAEELLLFIIKHCAGAPSAEPAKALLTHLQNKQAHDRQLRE